MSSKVFKSEKPKLKFAQSNINHVYRGNTAETQYKPAVRQYGMQVVGKLQGTRRLPPPAWVPSIKAESGGLDTRVALVPPGGSGWGAPTSTESTSAQPSGSATTEVGGSMVTAPLPSVNGMLTREALGTSFEPAYARSHLGTTTTASSAPTVDAPVSKTFNAWATTAKEGTAVAAQHVTESVAAADVGAGEDTVAPVPAWAPKSHSSSASGGLAANKPFFQRPVPVTSTSSSSTTPSVTKASESQSAATSGGASEIFGDTGGWAAISEEEPNFDEQIVFSDEECPDEFKTQSKTASTAEHTRVGSSASPTTPTFVSPPKSVPTANSPQLVQSSVSSKKEPFVGHTSVFASASSSLYSDSAGRAALDVWSTSDATAPPTALTGHSLVHLPTSLPYGGAQLIAGSNVNPDERLLLGSHQYMHQHATPATQTLPSVFPDPFLSSHQNAMADSILPTGDIDSELHAQRQARTQEFKSAVERAQQARAARQTMDNYNTEGDALIQRSVVNLISDSTEAHTSSALNAATAPANLLLPPNLQAMQPLLGNVLSSQLLSAYQQGSTHNRPELAAAMAAATAVAMACNGANLAPLRQGASTTPSNILKSASLPQGSHSNAMSTASAAWHGPFSTSTSASFSVRQPALPQFIQSTLAMASGGGQPVTSGSQNPMYLDPEFVERVLEILNNQQVSLPTADQVTSHRANMSLDPAMSATVVDNVPVDKSSQNESTARDITSKRTEPSDSISAVDSLKGTSKLNGQALQQRHSESVSSTDAKIAEQGTNKTEAKRIPGLMDVKVSSSRNFNLNWAEDDYLPSNLGGRSRGKSFANDRARGAGRGRRPVIRHLNDDSKSTRTRSTGPHETHENRTYATNYVSYQDRQHAVRHRNWHPSKSEHDSLGSELSNNPPVPSVLNHDISAQSESAKDDNLEELAEDSELKDTRRKGVRRSDHIDVFESRHSASNTSSKQRRGSLDLPDSNAPNADRQDYRRAERGRRGRCVPSSYYPSSRTFSNEDAMTHSGQAPESKSHGRLSRGITFTRGHRATVTVSTESRGSRAVEDSRARFTDRDYRGDYPHNGGYSSTRSTRSAAYHIPASEDQGDSFDPHHRFSQDSRRHQSFRNRVGAIPHASSRNHGGDDHFSDGEHGAASRRHNRAPRNRSHEGVRQSYKGTDQRFVGERERQKTDVQTSVHTDERTATTPPLDQPDDDYGDGDIPTVRVPAMDIGFNSRPYFTHSRSGRAGTFQRGSGPRRNPSRLASMQQNKRTAGSGVPTSHRYRDQRDRYRDDRDGNGGAAAGGTGRSATGGDSTTANGPGSGSHSNNCENVTGNQNSGDTRDDVNACDDFPLGGTSTADLETTGNKTDDVIFTGTTTNHNYVDKTNDPRNNRLASGTTGSSTAPGTRSGTRSTRTYISASGGRTGTGQRVQRTNAGRYYQSDYSTKRGGSCVIPPLMSIKPHGSFTRTSQALDSRVTVDAKPDVSENVLSDTAATGTVGCTKVLDESTKVHESSDANEDYSDQDSHVSDGFTKVVSKASKRLARRRMQQELSTSAKSAVRRTNESSKVTPSGQTVENKREHSSNQSTSGPWHAATGQNKVSPRKTKPLPVKPSFMGPPLSSVSTVVTFSETALSKSKVVTACTNTTILRTTKAAWVTPAATTSTIAPIDSPQNTVSTVRPWSKVVGTKSSSTRAASETVENRTPQNATLGLSSDGPEWSVDLKQTDDVSSSLYEGRSTVTTGSSINKDVQVVTLEMKEMDITDSYTSVRQLWSSNKDNDDEKLALKTSVAVPSVITCKTSPSSTGVTSTSISSTVSVSVSTVSNNICKVRPQQQQQPVMQLNSANPGLLTTNTPLPTATPISPTNQPSEQLQSGTICTSETSVDPERAECDYDGVSTPVRSGRRLPTDGALLVNPHPSNRPTSSSWGENLPSQTHANLYQTRPGTLPLATGMDSAFTANIWPTTDQLMDGYGNRLAPVGASAINQSYSQVHGSEVLSHLFAAPNTSVCADLSSKSQPVALIPRSHSYAVQPYGPSSADIHSYGGLYSGEGNKLSAQSQTASATGSVYVSPQHHSAGHQTQPTHSYPGNWAVPSNPQRYRQRFTHQMEPSAFGGFAYQTDLQNEYAFLPSATGCVQPPTAGSLFSAVQGQSNYHPHNSVRHNLGAPTTNNPWSLLGNPAGPSNLQAPTQDYGATLAPASGGGAGTGGGLLPHPVPPAGFNAPHGSVPLPISSSPNSNFVTHHNYVGVIGGGRPNANDLSNIPTRQRGVAQNIFPSHSITHSPSAAQSQPQFPVHSAFYPSLSPSHHQRLQQLHQFTGSQGRPNVANLMNPATGLYAAAFGTAAAAAQPNQPTPPPLPSQLGYTAFTSEPTVSAQMSFYSTSQSQSAVGLQHPMHTQRPGQPSAHHSASRTVGAVANHGGSPLLIPNAVGPSALSGYTQPTHSAALSGYPIKHVLPTL